MKTSIASFASLTFAIVFSHPSLGCNADHGYRKTAQLVEQSIISSQEKLELMRVISNSKSEHDRYTAENNNLEMKKSVQKLLKIRYELKQ